MTPIIRIENREKAIRAAIKHQFPLRTTRCDPNNQHAFTIPHSMSAAIRRNEFINWNQIVCKVLAETLAKIGETASADSATVINSHQPS